LNVFELYNNIFKFLATENSKSKVEFKFLNL